MHGSVERGDESDAEWGRGVGACPGSCCGCVCARARESLESLVEGAALACLRWHVGAGFTEDLKMVTDRAGRKVTDRAGLGRLGWWVPRNPEVFASPQKNMPLQENYVRYLRFSGLHVCECFCSQRFSYM